MVLSHFFYFFYSWKVSWAGCFEVPIFTNENQIWQNVSFCQIVIPFTVYIERICLNFLKMDL